MLLETFQAKVKVTLALVHWIFIWIIILLYLSWTDVCLISVSNVQSYLQNSSKRQLSLNRGISKQWIETKRWSDKSSGSERHVDICLSLLSLSFPSFYFLPHSDQRDCNPQLSVQTDSVRRFPSIFLSLTHTHKQITSLLFCTQMHFFFPFSHLYQKSQGLTPRWKRGGCFLPWAGTCLLQTIKRYCSLLY